MTSGKALFYIKYSIGFWGWYGFGYWASSISFQLTRETWWLNHFGLMALFCIVIATVYALLPKRTRGSKYPRSPVFDWVCAALASAAALVLGVPSLGQGYPGLVVAAVVLVAATQTWYLIRWGSLYSRMGARDLMGILLVGVIVVSTLKMLYELVIPQAAVALFMVLPFALTWVYGRCSSERKPEVAKDRSLNARGLLSFWRLAVTIALFFAMWSFLNITLNYQVGHFVAGQASPTMLILFSQLIDIAFALGMFWWVFVKERAVAWVLLWHVAFALLGLALLTMSILGYTHLIQLFTSAAVELVYMFVIYLLAFIARHSTYSPASVFGFGFSYVLLIDWAVRGFVSAWGFTDIDAIVPVFLFVIVLIVAFFLPARYLSMQYLSDDLEMLPLGEGDQGDLTQRCMAVALDRGLSSREEEILEHLCRGRSKPYIAETLYLSENTIKTYTRRVYRKLGVHNRQELIDLCEGREVHREP